MTNLIVDYNKPTSLAALILMVYVFQNGFVPTSVKQKLLREISVHFNFYIKIMPRCVPCMFRVFRIVIISLLLLFLPFTFPLFWLYFLMGWTVRELSHFSQKWWYSCVSEIITSNNYTCTPPDIFKNSLSIIIAVIMRFSKWHLKIT